LINIFIKDILSLSEYQTLMVAPAAQPLLTATQLGQLLRAARKQRGLTQAEVGARLGLSQNRVSHLEGHADELSVRQLLTWCAVVGLELGLGQRQIASSEPEASAVSAGSAARPEW
jgi:HTH-type transcriptional regulator/antitoxin HipB